VNEGDIPLRPDIGALPVPPASRREIQRPGVPVVLGVLGAGIYYLASFVPFSGFHGATYPPVNFRVSPRFWGPELALDTLLTLARIAIVVIAVLSARWRGAAWGALTAIGALGVMIWAYNLVSVVNAVNPGTPEVGAYLYVASNLLLLTAGVLGLKHIKEPAQRPTPDGVAPEGGGSGPSISSRLLLLGCSLALILPLALSPVTARAQYGPLHIFRASNVDGSPVRWDPCRNVHYVVNVAGAPAGIQSTIDEAVHELAAATGISFVYDGPTTEVPLKDRPDVSPFAPVLIAWARPGEGGDVPLTITTGLDAHGVELANWLPYGTGSHEWIGGEIVLNARDSLPPGFGSSAAWGPVLLHELGHLAGLGHVNSPFEIMYPGPGFARHYAAGDLEGLRLLGRSRGCIP
jgi:hypothetical protein